MMINKIYIAINFSCRTRKASGICQPQSCYKKFTFDCNHTCFWCSSTQHSVNDGKFCKHFRSEKSGSKAIKMEHNIVSQSQYLIDFPTKLSTLTSMAAWITGKIVQPHISNIHGARRRAKEREREKVRLIVQSLRTPRTRQTVPLSFVHKFH